MEILDSLLSENGDMVARIGDAVVARLPVYRGMPREDLDAGIRIQVVWVLRSSRSGSATLTEDDLAAFAAAGERQQRNGIPFDDMIRAWRIGIESLVTVVRQLSAQWAAEGGELWRFTESMLESSAVALSETVTGYRRAELDATDILDTGRARFVRGVMLGLVPATELRVRAEMYGLDPAGEFVAARARLGDGVSQHGLELALGIATPSPHRCGLCAVVDGDLAALLTQPPPRDFDGQIGYGPPRQLERLADSYRLAARALVTVLACKLTGAHDLESLGLRSAVAVDVDMGALLRRRYLAPLANGGSGEDLIATLRAYLACGMHVESTATRLFVHQNTVRYRLARFEELTGTSLRDTEVLVELWWALELSAMRM